MGRRGGLIPALGLLILVAVIASSSWAVKSTGNALTGELKQQEVIQLLEGANRGKIDIDFGVGSLELDGFSSQEYLVKGILDITDSERLQQSHRLVNGTVYFSITSEGQQVFPFWWFSKGSDQQRQWKMSLNEGLPLELDIHTGVGRSELDLQGMQISGLNLETGVGKTILYLPREGNFNASVNAGVGELDVYIPKGLPVRITLKTGLGNNNVAGDYTQSGNVYTSQNYAQAESRSTVYIDGGVGNINVIQLGD
jgi:hypothetical protein